MKSRSLFKPAFLFTFLFIICIYTRGQAILPFTYDSGNPGTSVTGLTQSGLGSDYSTSPRMKFDTALDYLILNFSGVPGTLSFKIKWNQGVSASRFPGDFTLQESPDGITYTTVQLYNSTNGTPLTNAVTVTEVFTNLLPASRFVKWIYTSKTNGNIGIGALSLTAGNNPVFNLSTNSLTGFTYLTGHGPSAEQSFSISGSTLYGNIIVTPPADYEISTGTGGLFVANNPLTLVQTNGVVAGTTIYTRLIQGLSVGKYSENIAVSSVGAVPVSIACDGNVTPDPTITLTDITDPTLNTYQGIPVSQTINVSGVNLGVNMTMALSGADAGLFSLSQYSVNQTAGSVPNTIVTITYSPVSPGSSTATFTVTSPGAMPVNRKLYGNSTITTGLNAPVTPFIVTVENGNVIFTAVAGETVEIFNAIGQKQIQKLTVDGMNTIPLAVHGVLLVKIGNRVAKVIM